MRIAAALSRYTNVQITIEELEGVMDRMRPRRIAAELDWHMP